MYFCANQNRGALRWKNERDSGPLLSVTMLCLQRPGAVSDAAVRQKEEQERKLKSATYTTYGLFTPGRGLGLIGKVLKLPALGGGE